MLHQKQREDGTFKNNRYLNLKKNKAVHETAAQKHFCESNYAEPLKYFSFLPCAKKNVGWDCSGISFPQLGNGRKEEEMQEKEKRKNLKKQESLTLY